VAQFVEAAGAWPPEPVVPAQDVTPWRQTIEHQLSDQGSYQRVAEASRAASLAYVSQITVDPFEHFLQKLTPSLAAGSPIRQRRADSLSNQQRALLALKLSRQQKTAVTTQAAEAS
jgi:hypothetical protein